jgi:hypothetical protein
VRFAEPSREVCVEDRYCIGSAVFEVCSVRKGRARWKTRTSERRWIAIGLASGANDSEAEHQIYREDAVLEYPQAGERIPGRRNIQASCFAQQSRTRFTVRRMAGTADVWIIELVITYDARSSYTANIMEFRDGKVARETQYFGDPFEPEPPRDQWVERMR